MHTTYNNNKINAAVTSTEDGSILYTKVKGHMRYVPVVYRVHTHHRIQLAGYTRKEDAERARANILANNVTLTGTPPTPEQLELLKQERTARMQVRA